MTYVIIHGRGLSGLGSAEAVPFAEGIRAAERAFGRLAALGTTLKLTATDLPQQGIGEQVVRFAKVS